MGYCDGIQYQEGGVTHTRCMTEAEVTAALGTDRWIPIKRFGVEQKNKIRGVDDASDSLINATSSRPEKRQISSVDRIMALVTSWTALCPDASLGAWALDEFKAYRQIPVATDQRHLSVVALVNPNLDERGTPRPVTEYVIMNGHCFGYTNAVYNYCRRPLAVRKVLQGFF